MILPRISVRVRSGLKNWALPNEVAGCLIEYGMAAALNNGAGPHPSRRTDGQVGDDDALPMVADGLPRIIITRPRMPPCR